MSTNVCSVSFTLILYFLPQLADLKGQSLLIRKKNNSFGISMKFSSALPPEVGSTQERFPPGY